MNLRKEIQSYVDIRTMIHPLRYAFLLKSFIDLLRPVCSPGLKCLRISPVGILYGIEDIIPVFIFHPFSIFIKYILTMLFISPGAVRIQRSHGYKHMDMRIRNIVRILSRLMNSHITDHSPGDKILPDEFFCDPDIFFHVQFVLKCKIERVGKLRFRMFLDCLHFIPEYFAI